MNEERLAWDEPASLRDGHEASRKGMDLSERNWSIIAVSLSLVYFLIGASIMIPVVETTTATLVGGNAGDTSSSITLVSPSNGATVSGSTATLSWNSSSAASYFGLRVSESSDLTDPYNVTTRQNSLVLNGLEIGTTYYWSVCPIINNAYGIWSDVWSFTAGSPSGSPTPVAPLNNTIYIDEIPVLAWTTVTGASAYRVEISTDANFTDILTSAEVSGTNYTASEMTDVNTTYYWRVAAETGDGWTDWSPQRALFVSPLTYTVTRTWTFYADDSTWTLSTNVSAEDYWGAKTLPRGTMHSEQEYANYVTYDEAVNETAAQLSAMAASKGYDEYTTACFVLSFVQNIRYDSDLNTTGEEEYPRYPVETLVDGVGDCEDTSILFASLIQTSYFGLDAVLVSLSTPNSDVGHMAVGLYFDRSDLPSEVSFTYNGTKYTLSQDQLLSWEVRTYRYGQSYGYYYCECTSVMPIGWPTEVESWYYTLIPC
ncbi:MAG: hypothetical protein SA339_08480 [Methanomassiliicoccus sp.]|nr:hypothetical protein [Methanomassiliicoccus sp.]